LNKFNRIISLLKILLFSKKTWVWPQKSKVLIFDGNGKEFILEYLQPWSPEVLYLDGEQLNMLVLFSSLFKKGKQSTSYIDCFIKKVNPRLIVTLIDNNHIFYSISSRHPYIKTLFIQNGWRGHYYNDKPIAQIKQKNNISGLLTVDYMMTFGKVSGIEYAKYLCGKTIPIGSIKSNNVKITKKYNNNTIGFVSQWHDGNVSVGNRPYLNKEFFEKADKLIISCLTKYANENDKELFIIPRHPVGSRLAKREENYFQNMLGCNAKFIRLVGSSSCYQAIDSFQVVVVVDSTLGYESLARGNKTAIFSIRGSILNESSLNFGWPKTQPDTGPFWTNIPDQDLFNQILNNLFEISYAQWLKTLDEENFSSFMQYNLDNSIFKSFLLNELEIKEAK